MREVYNFLSKKIIINKDDAIVVAVSYGPDSMALLSMLKFTYPDLKIICAHVHHNHRKESDNEAINLKKYCDDNNIIFEMMKIGHYKNDKFTEEEARTIRYKYFEEILYKYNAKYLFTAHHGDDLVETILMRLTRGSSLKGYAGIKQISNKNNYVIVRPLLYVTKDDLLEYCKDNKIPYAVDKSNKDNTYTRNRYRNNILPLLKEENKDVHLKFLKYASVLNEYEEYIQKETKKVYKQVINNNKIDINKLVNQDNLIIKKVLEEYLFNIYNEDINLISDKHMNLLLNLINSDASNKILSFPNKINIIRSYNYIYFDINNEYNDYCYIYDDYIELPNDMVIETIDSLENTSNYVSAFDTSELNMPLYVRNRQDGDRIEVLGMKGSKKIKDIFINSKIDEQKRNDYPILVDSKGNILWLPGLKKSKYDKSKNGKYDIILRYREKEENNDTK